MRSAGDRQLQEIWGHLLLVGAMGTGADGRLRLKMSNLALQVCSLYSYILAAAQRDIVKLHKASGKVMNSTQGL